jgi:RHS repeat-associated protein
VTHFVYDRENVLLDFVDTDGVAGVAVPGFDKLYFYGTGADQVLAQENAGGNVVLHPTDRLGTVRDLVGNSGAVLNHFTCDSFGNVISETNQPVETRYLFTGREFDGETGLYYYRARYYDGGVGRFLSEDSIGFAGGDMNLYRYVGNTPTIATAPTGLQFVEWSLSPKSVTG